MALSRITEYWPGAGQAMMDEMESGLSLTAAAAKLGILKIRIYDWEKAHPEFAESMQYARQLRLLNWEERHIKIAEGSLPGANVAASIFGLLNADPEEWRQRREPNIAIINTGQTDPIQMAMRIASILERAARQVGNDPQIVDSTAERVEPG